MTNKGQFQKGVSGNPKGRPKSGEAITDLFREYLEGTDETTKLTRKRMLVEELYARAMGKKATDKRGKPIQLPGSDELLKYIVNRLDGMPRQAVDLEAFVDGEESLTVFIERPSGAPAGRADEGREDSPACAPAERAPTTRSGAHAGPEAGHEANACS
jgi:hypothetical protein